MNIKILGAFAAVALLAACSSSETAKPMVDGTAVRGPVPGSQEDLVANVGDRVFFDFNQASLKGTGGRPANNMSTLDKQAAWLAQWKQNNVQIAGNCDERGTTDYNLALGGRRAYAAYTYLMAKGVPAGRMTTISYGKDRPLAPGSTEEAWAKNRNAITSAR